MAEHKRRGLRIALIILALVIVVPVAGLGILVLTFDANRLKPRIVTAIQQATGRDVAIDGAVRLALSLRPTLEVDAVKLANAPGFTPPSMATLDRLDLRLALLPLLHRHVEIEQLDLMHPVIALQIDEHGRDNWHFARPPVAPNAEPAPQHAETQTARPTSLRIQTMSITDGAITFSDSRTHASFGADAVQMTATQSDPDGAIHLEATAIDRKMPIAVSGNVGRPHDEFMPIDLTLIAAEASLNVRGTAPGFAVSGSIPDLAALSPLAGKPLPGLHITSFRTDVAPPIGGSYANGIVLTGLSIGAPTGDLNGDAAITLAAPVVIRATLTGSNVDPAALIAAMPVPDQTVASAPPGPTSPAPAPVAPSEPPPPPTGKQAAWLMSDRPLAFASIPDNLDADLTLALQDTKLGEAVLKSANTHAVLHAGHLVLDPLAIDAPGGHVDAAAMVDAAGAAALTMRAPSLSMQPLLSAFDQPDGVRGTVEVRANLHGSGMTPHALAASLDGGFGLALANGEIDNRLLIALLSRVAPEAGLLDLAGKTARSSLRCVALRVDIAHGVGDLHALLLDTEPLRLTGSGTFDLAQETLSMRLLPLARIGATGMSVPVSIRGSFRAPHASVDATGAGGSLGGLVMGALGTDRLIAGSGQSDGCAEQLQSARFGDQGPLPPALPTDAPGKPTPPNLNNLLKQLLR